jgi:hypothetical protein
MSIEMSPREVKQIISMMKPDQRRRFKDAMDEILVKRRSGKLTTRQEVAIMKKHGVDPRGPVLTNYWFAPKKHSGWSKKDPAKKRRLSLMRSTDKRKTRHDRYLEAGRRALALANVTRDPQTKTLSRRDADYFFMLAKKTGRGS